MRVSFQSRFGLAHEMYRPARRRSADRGLPLVQDSFPLSPETECVNSAIWPSPLPPSPPLSPIPPPFTARSHRRSLLASFAVINYAHVFTLGKGWADAGSLESVNLNSLNWCRCETGPSNFSNLIQAPTFNFPIGRELTCATLESSNPCKAGSAHLYVGGQQRRGFE